MSAKPESCRRLEPDLLATAAREAAPEVEHRVREHARSCPGCRSELTRYEAIEGAVAALRKAPATPVPAAARESLADRLADLRDRLVRYRIFPSPLGRLLVARSAGGVSLVEYLDRGAGLSGSRLAGSADVEAVEDGDDADVLYRDLVEYLEGRRDTFAWPLDFRLVRSDFHRRVLEATAAIPYGAVTSYAWIARTIGKPDATRAVAQALRHNPLPIVVPCHRIVGASGALTGYAGNRVALKERLLAVEGVRTIHRRSSAEVARGRMYARPGDEGSYCLPACTWVASESLAKLTLYASRERAESSGLEPCGDCRPDLHPLTA